MVENLVEISGRSQLYDLEESSPNALKSDKSTNENGIVNIMCLILLRFYDIIMLIILLCILEVKMPDISEDKWINIDDAAEYLGVKVGTIRDWLRKKKDIPAHKIGKMWKFKRSELDAWVKSGKSAIE